MNYSKLTCKLALLGLIFNFCGCAKKTTEKEVFADFTADMETANVEFFWKNDGENFKSILNLKQYAENKGKHLRFATNGGMFREDRRPLGLFIQEGKTVAGLNTGNAEGNFYLQPNGVFYITENRQAAVVKTADFQNNGQIKFATQSGPMLVVNGQINPLFMPQSANLNIRNGVCVLNDKRVAFSISRVEVNFYDFAAHFKNLGCQNALYLDGYVSRMYLPEQNSNDLDGDFGVIIGIVE